MQERAIEEVKLAIKPFYQKRDITKDEYKEILRKAVQKVNPMVYEVLRLAKYLPLTWVLLFLHLSEYNDENKFKNVQKYCCLL